MYKITIALLYCREFGLSLLLPDQALVNVCNTRSNSNMATVGFEDAYAISLSDAAVASLGQIAIAPTQFAQIGLTGTKL